MSFGLEEFENDEQTQIVPVISRLLDVTRHKDENWRISIFCDQGNPMLKQVLLLSRLLSFSALMATSAVAAPVVFVGFDDMSCRAWVKSKEDVDQRKIYLAWIRGVLTGHNYANQKQQVSSISTGTVENFITRYCTDKPLGEFSDAALRLSDMFSGRNEAIVK